MWRKAPRHSEYERQPAPKLRFEPWALDRRCRDRRRGVPVDAEPGSSFVVAGDEPEYHLTRSEALVIRRGDAPTLTITSDPHNSIFVVGGAGPDWTISLCAYGAGASEPEARERLQHVSMRVSPGTVSLETPGLYGGTNQGATLIVDGPADAGLVVHASYSYVEVREMTASVRIAASHASAKVLNVAGQTDVMASCVDYSGSSGCVTLSAEAEINLKIPTTEFDGRILAWAQRTVRMLVPAGFASSVEAVVASAGSFVGRADVATHMKPRRQGELHLFTNRPDAEIGRDFAALHLRSEASTVVIDNA